MAIQLSGGPNVNYTFTPTTRTSIVTGIETALTSAGWTGAGTMTSGTTPDGLFCVCTLVDPGGTASCAQVIMPVNTSGTITGFLSTSGSRTLHVIACPYQFFVCVAGEYTAGNAVVGMGVPYLEPVIAGAVTQSAWAMRNGHQDASADGVTFRRASYLGIVSLASTRNGIASTNENTSGTGDAECMLIVEYGCGRNINEVAGTKWYGGEYFKIPPRLCWAITNEDSSRIRGQLWDAQLVAHEFPGDTTFTDGDGNKWFNFMHNNSTMHLSLWLLIPS